MIVYPAIDIIQGQCVRLRQGDFAQQTTYAVEPLSLASDYARNGADWLHIVDLDAAKGDGNNLAIITAIAASLPVQVQSGGGVRTAEDIQIRLHGGITRVVVGSVAVQQPEQFCQWLHAFTPAAITAALDVRAVDGRWVPAIAGWQQQSDTDLFTLLDRFVDAGLAHLLCTDIDRDGMLQGPNVELYAQLKKRYPNLHVQASGGVHAVADLSALASINADGVIIGKALLDGRFSLNEALNEALQETSQVTLESQA